MLIHQRKRPITSVLTGAFMISFSGIWVVLAEVTPSTSAFYRVFFGFLFLLIASLISKERLNEYKQQFVPIILCGLAFSFDLYFWHASIKSIGPGLATIIGNFQVFFMAGCGYFFFGEKIRPRFLFAMPLALFGLFLVIGFNWPELTDKYKAGVMYGFMTAVCYTLFLLLLRSIQINSPRNHNILPLTMTSFTSCLFLGIMIPMEGGSFLLSSAKSIVSLLCLGLFSQTIGWMLIAFSMPKIRASLTGLILLLQPTLAFIWDVLFFSRPTDFIDWTGTSITLLAIYLGITGSKAKQ